MIARCTRRSLLLLAAVALLSAGCVGSHNPGYFPYYIPGGPIKETHAKPGGFGYFRDFDPKAVKLEITPQNATAPLGSQIVLLATVYDKDGQPRRSRRVEWILEGPGNIVEVDESGFYAGRGYKVDNKYAVSYTNYSSRTITRGNNDSKDDVTISAGQTFCVVSSAVPGETVLTAYAPGVFNWENGRVVARVVWGEGRFLFPAPAVVKYGGELTLTTTVNHFESDGPQPNYRVRYRIVDGVDSDSAVLVSRTGSGVTGSQSGTNSRETEAAVDSNGAAAVRLVQVAPRPGRTRIAIEVVKPSENGTGPGTVVSRRETEVEWSAPEVKLSVTAPPVASPNGTFPATIALVNTGKVDARDSRVRVTLSDGATLANFEPPPVRQDATGFFFDLPPVAAGKTQQIALQVRPANVGVVTVTAAVVTNDRLQAEDRATTQVEKGKLAVVVELPPTGLAGERIPVKVAITNAAATPATNATVWARFDDAFKHASGQNPVELSAGNLAPGQTKTFDLPLTAKTAGRYSIRVTGTADGNVAASAEAATIEIRRAELRVAVIAPKMAYLNQDFTWTIGVANSGDSPVSNILVRATLPPDVKLTDAGEGRAGAGSVEWRLPELKAGEQRTLKLTLGATRLTGAAVLSVVAMGDSGGANGPKPTGDPVQARGEASTAIIGTPALVLELVAPPGQLEIGKRAVYKVRLKNQGTVSARNVELAVLASGELTVARATGPADGRIETGGKVMYPSVEEIHPGETVTFTIEVEAVQTGESQFRVEVRAPHLTNTLKDEQSRRVISSR